MSKPVKLRSPKYRIVLGNPVDETTWEGIDVQAISPDLQQAEALFARHRWGKAADSPLKFVSASGYFALRRTGKIAADTSYDEFLTNLIEVSAAEDGDDVDPTQPDPAAG